MKKRKGRSIYVISAVALAAVIYLIVQLAPGGIDTPTVALPSVSASSPAQDNSPASGPGAARADVGPDTVQAVIRKIAPAGIYSRVIGVHTYWQGGESSSSITVYARNGQLRITEDDGYNVRNVLIDGETLSLWYDDGSAGVFHGAAAAVEASRLQRMVSVGRILELPRVRITDAGYGDLQGEPCVWLTFTNDGLAGTTEKAYISVNTGLLMGNDSFAGDTLKISLRSEPVDTVSTPADENFVAPGN